MTSKENKIKLNDFKRGSIIFPATPENIKICGEHIKRGHLVCFPTETVYGLGADALNSKAVLKIFQAKERPLTDPVIVHVCGFNSMTLSLIHANVPLELLTFFEILSKAFWPGPLTIVMKCNQKKIPQNITGGTGCVGIRCPKNNIARELIKMAGTPIAAPSANKFGHISPTSYKHVHEDLGNTKFPIMILKGNENEKKNGKKKCCEVGIESTVVKIECCDDGEKKKGGKGKKKEKILLKILRKGGTSTHALKSFSENINRNEKMNFSIDVKIISKIVKVNSKELQDSPGQCITHYSPNIPSFLIKNFKRSSELEKEYIIEKDFSNQIKLKHIVLIDFFGYFVHLKKKVLKYLDLSERGDVKEAANLLFKCLRIAEKVKNAKVILLPNLDLLSKEHSDACHDRLFRAASGKYCILNNEFVNTQ